MLLVVNKLDRQQGLAEAEESAAPLACSEDGVPLFGLAAPSPAYAELLSLCRVFAVSAKLGSGLDALAEGVRAAVGGGDMAAREGDVAPNIRQALLLESALAELDALADDLAQDMPADILGVRLDLVVHFLDEVTGVSSTEELLDRIFASFCIGK